MEMNEQKHSQAAILGLQHLLAMYAGSILVRIMIAGALNYSAEQLTYLISTDIFMCGLQHSYNFNCANTLVLGFQLFLDVLSNQLLRFQSLVLNKVQGTCLVL